LRSACERTSLDNSRSILLVTSIVAIVLGFTLNIWIAMTFVLGVFTSLITVYMGMSASTRANVKTADDATHSINAAFHTAVFGGSIMGFSITGFGLVVLSALYLPFKDPTPSLALDSGPASQLSSPRSVEASTRKLLTSEQISSARSRRIFPRTTRGTQLLSRTWLATTSGIALAEVQTCSRPSLMISSQGWSLPSRGSPQTEAPCSSSPCFSNQAVL